MSLSNGKFIISGEHSVVYGESAIVCELKKSINIKIEKLNKGNHLSEYELHIFNLFAKRYKVDVTNLSIKVESELPQKSGLGSSAAFAHALLKTLAEYFEIIFFKDELFDLVLACETIIHKNPSGIDPFAVVYGGCHSFKKNIKTKEFKNENIVLGKNYDFLLVNSGSATESTGEMVLAVAKLLKTDVYKKDIIRSIGKITNQIKQELIEGTFTGKLLNQNQKELEKLNIVGKRAKTIIKKIQDNGAYAKVTGAGGTQTGSGWILVYSNNLSKIEGLCDQNTWEYIKTRV